MLKAVLTTITAVAVVEMREDIANGVKFVAKKARKMVKERVDATRT